MEDIFAKLYDMTAFSNIIADPSFLIMYAIAFILLYLGIRKHYEPLLLVPIAFGVLIANFPGGDMGVIQADENGMVMVNGVLKNIWEMPLHEIAHDLGLMNFVYYMLIKTGFLPPVIFMGVGALTDFGPMLRNLRLSIFGAAAQLGIFTVLLCAVMMGFTPQEAGALGIIGGADGPTAIFTTIKLAPHLLGPIAIAAYSYMALVPVIIPLVLPGPGDFGAVLLLPQIMAIHKEFRLQHVQAAFRKFHLQKGSVNPLRCQDRRDGRITAACFPFRRTPLRCFPYRCFSCRPFFRQSLLKSDIYLSPKGAPWHIDTFLV